jgi:hypothetical protein
MFWLVGGREYQSVREPSPALKVMPSSLRVCFRCHSGHQCRFGHHDVAPLQSKVSGLRDQAFSGELCAVVVRMCVSCVTCDSCLVEIARVRAEWGVSGLKVGSRQVSSLPWAAQAWTAVHKFSVRTFSPGGTWPKCARPDFLGRGRAMWLRKKRPAADAGAVASSAPEQPRKLTRRMTPVMGPPPPAMPAEAILDGCVLTEFASACIYRGITKFGRPLLKSVFKASAGHATSSLYLGPWTR